MNIDRYKTDVDKLLLVGNDLLLSMVLETRPDTNKQLKVTEEERAALPDVRTAYQPWYSEALAAVTQLLPDRVNDFIAYYAAQKGRKEVTYANYTISDYLQGLHVTRRFSQEQVVGPDAAVGALRQQVQIVEAIKNRFESSLFDIRALVQADLFDDELDAAEELNKKGFHRAAGAVAGVVLEGHLVTVCDQHNVKTPKHPSIGELNDLLKKANVIEVPTWRFIQRLGDLRNLCDHKKKCDPKSEEIEELIAGTRKTIKTIF